MQLNLGFEFVVSVIFVDILPWDSGFTVGNQKTVRSIELRIAISVELVYPVVLVYLTFLRKAISFRRVNRLRIALIQGLS